MQSLSWKASCKSSGIHRLTPKPILDDLRTMLGRGFGLDPAPHPDSFVYPEKSYLLPASVRNLFDLIDREKSKPKEIRNIELVKGLEDQLDGELQREDLDNGLLKPWRGFGPVWCNPPYSRKWTPLWINKMVKEFYETEGSKDELYTLLPARVGSGWFQDLLLPRLDAFCIFKGRLGFGGQNDTGEEISDPAPFESMLCYIGQRPRRFVLAFQKYGWTKLHPYYRLEDDFMTPKVFVNE